jgi:outer membrane protein assembly factor BamB
MTRTSAFVAAACAAVGLTGCWPAPGQGPDRAAYNAVETGFDAASVAGFTEIWTATTGEPGPRGVGHPIVSEGGGVHVTTSRSVVTFEASTGAPRWSSTPDTSTPTYEEVDTDTFLFNDFVTTSVRLSGSRWEAAQCQVDTGGCDTLGGEVPGRVEAIRSAPSSLTMLLSRFEALPGGGTAQSAWTYFTFTPPVLLTEQPNRSRLTLGAGHVFHAGVGIGTAPGNGVRAVPVAGSGIGWTTPIDGADATSPVLSPDGSTVYVGTDAGTLYALATADGRVLWTADVPEGVGTAPALAEGTLYVPNRTGSLWAFDATGCGSSTCDPLWSTTEVSAMTVQPAVAAGVVFTGSADGSVHAFDATGCGGSTCDPRWSHATGSRITGAPAVSLGKLFVGTQDGRLIAFGLPPA